MIKDARILVLTGMLTLNGCGLEPFDLRAPQDMASGPGLFSGADGEFTVSAGRMPNPTPPPAKTPATNSSTGNAVPTDGR